MGDLNALFVPRCDNYGEMIMKLQKLHEEEVHLQSQIAKLQSAVYSLHSTVYKKKAKEDFTDLTRTGLIGSTSNQNQVHERISAPIGWKKFVKLKESTVEELTEEGCVISGGGYRRLQG